MTRRKLQEALFLSRLYASCHSSSLSSIYLVNSETTDASRLPTLPIRYLDLDYLVPASYCKCVLVTSCFHPFNIKTLHTYLFITLSFNSMGDFFLKTAYVRHHQSITFHSFYAILSFPYAFNLHFLFLSLTHTLYHFVYAFT